jgi:heme oxygenase
MIDRMLLGFNLSRKPDYSLFLHIHYSALQGLEADWRPEDCEDFAEMLRRARADLHGLGVATSDLLPMPRTPGRQGNRVGVAYVIRGSRLGAAFLRRGVPSQFPSEYLDFAPAMTWTQFLQQLERPLEDPSSGDCQDAIQGARVTFETFASQYTRAVTNDSA